MDALDLAQAVWRKSTRSSGNGNCVEVAILDTAVAVRDTKDRGGPALIFTPAGWAAFTTDLHSGAYDQ